MIPRSEIVIREEIERKPAKPRHTPSLLYYHMKYPERNAQALKNARLSWKELSVKRKRKYQSLFSKECTHYGRKVIKYLKNYDQKWWHAIVTKEQLPIQIPDVF